MYPPNIGGGGLRGVALNDYNQGCATTSAPRETLQQALDEQDKHVNDLHATISQLEERLSLVLGPYKSDASINPPAPAPTSILDRSRNNSRAINQAIARLSSLMERLHL